jgi:hypothetical protein
VIDYFPGSVIDVNDWIELQSMLCWKSRGFTITQTSQGRTIVVAGEIDASATAIIDGPTHGGAGAISWHNRFVQAWGAYDAGDIIAAGADDDLTVLADTQRIWLATAKLGNSGTAYTHALKEMDAATDSPLSMTVNASGDLQLINADATPYNFVLMIRCTPVHTIATETDTQPWINATDITNAQLGELADSAEIRDGNGGGTGWTQTSLFSGDRGAMRRILYTGPLGKASATGSVNRVVLDSSEDWRRRYLLVSAVTNSGTAFYNSIARNGASARGGSAVSTAVPRLFFTGNGAATGSATASAYQHPDSNVNPEIWIFADSTTGNLVAEMKSTDSTSNHAAALFLVTASERYDGTSVAVQVPLHATQIHALDLNQPQNNGCFAQGMQGKSPRYLATSLDPSAEPTNPPLGLIAEGMGGWRRPVQYRVRERVGRVDDSTWLVRQPIIGQRKRVVSITVPAATTVAVDLFNDPTGILPGSVDQVDFRDRFIQVEGRIDSTDITIFRLGSTQLTDVGGSEFAFCFYSGPYADQTFTTGILTMTVEFSRDGSSRGYHSRLVISHSSGSTRYVNMTIEATGYLGLTDRRLFGATT